MKKILLICVTLTLAYTTQSQVVFTVEEPPSLSGGKLMTYTDNLNDWTSMVDLQDPENSILQYLELVDDGSAEDSLGCGPLNNDFGGLVDSLSILNPGTGYASDQGVATNAITGTGTGLVVDVVASPDGAVLDFDPVDAGSEYVTSTEVATTGGDGTGLTVDIIASEIGGADAFTISDAGTNYTLGTGITVTGGNGTGLTVEITNIDGGGEILDLDIENTGSGYNVNDVVTIETGDENAEIEITQVTNGEVTSISINDGGADYLVGNTIAIDGGNDVATFEVTNVADGSIAEIHVVNPGEGYELEDTVELVSGGNGDAQFRVEELTGKIALVYRGECQFGTKALNAQNAGAIGVVIIQNEPGGPVGMAAGTDGPNVEIPTVMISDLDGADIRSELDAGGDVKVFIGNKSGRFEYDMVVRSDMALLPKEFARPSLITQDPSEHSFDVGAWVFNQGFEDQSGVMLNATVTDPSGDIVYNETSNPQFIEFGDSAFIPLPEYQATIVDEGFYDFSYVVSADEPDDYDLDNELNYGFAITDGLYGYAPLDENDLTPNAPAGFRAVVQGETVDQFSSCIHFRDPNASRMIVTGITFSASIIAGAVNPSLQGEPISLYGYKVDESDEFIDVNDPSYDNELFPVLVSDWGEYIYNDDLQREPVTGYFDNPVELEDNARYVFCVESLNSDLYFGHNTSYADYNLNLNNYLQPLFPIQAEGSFNMNGFGPHPVPGVTLNLVDAAQLNVQNQKLAIEMNAYPSPATDYVTIDFKGNEVNGIEVRNMTGQLVLSENIKVGEDSRQLNVQGLDNGLYMVNVKLTNGLTKTLNVVVNR